MARVAARVSDKPALKVFRAFLNAGVMEDGLVSPVGEGTPQGGPLSPILSNLVLDDLDKELARCGHRFCRDADDCNIYVRSRRAGERAVASVSRFLTNKLRLKGNEAKSAVARPEECKFLGFSISNDRAAHRAKGSSNSARLRESSRTSKRGSVEDCVSIFGGSGEPLRRTMPSRHIEVQCGGGCRLAHGHLANVRTPVGPALRNSDFDSLGLPRIYAPSQA